jgi:hypothetical protein
MVMVITNYRPALVAAITTAALLPLSACGGSTPPPNPVVTTASSSAAPSAEPSGQPTATATGGVDPNAPEVNDAGDIPDNQVFVPYSPSSKLFVVKVPEGWSRITSGGAVIFDGKLNRIRIELTPRASAPTEAAVRDEVARIGAASTGFKAVSLQTTDRHAGKAVLAKYRADAAPDPVTGKVVNDDVERYEFWHGGQLLTLTLSGPHGADNVDPWRIVTDSVRWQR